VPGPTGATGPVGATGATGPVAAITEIDGGVFDSIAPFDGGFPTTTVFSATYDGGTP
jgi:hypothetical protein